jgi:hypothetical protein
MHYRIIYGILLTFLKTTKTSTHTNISEDTFTWFEDDPMDIREVPDSRKLDVSEGGVQRKGGSRHSP